MDSFSSKSLQSDKETRDLQFLTDAFTSICSLEEIASAYCRANGRVSVATEILSNVQGDRSNGGTNLCNDQVACTQSAVYVEDDKVHSLMKHSKGLKPKKLIASTGSVSSVLGKGTTKPHLHSNGMAKPDKPAKLELLQPEASVDIEATGFSANTTPLSNRDVEAFLFSMLQDGFNLDEGRIREVLCSCGYDGQKSIEVLLDSSSCNLVKDNKTYGEMKMIANKDSRVKTNLANGKYPTRAAFHREVSHSSQCLQEKQDASREVLEALFKPSKGPEEQPKRTFLMLGLNRTRAVGKQVVCTPLFETDMGITDVQKQENSREDEDNYVILRKAAKEHWEAMKAYYGAAFDAFIKGDRDKVNHLLEKGKHHNEMAQEADEKTNREIAGASKGGLDIFTLDLHMHYTKEARSLLRSHLQSLARISTIRYLRVIVDSGTEDVTKGKRKKSVINFLERKQIEWSEEEGRPGTLVIQMDLVEPEKF